MTGTTRTSAGLDPRRRRILFRAWHRGIREMDLVLGSFCDAEIAALTGTELDALEAIMDHSDGELLKWVTGERPVPDAFDTPLFRRIAAYQPDFAPIAENGASSR